MSLKSMHVVDFILKNSLRAARWAVADIMWPLQPFSSRQACAGAAIAACWLALRGYFRRGGLGLRMRKAIVAAALVTAFIGAAAAQEAPKAVDPSASAAPADSAPSSASWSAEVDAARARHDDWLACIEARRFKCDDKAKADPMAALLNDDTLVDGDIVSTHEGLKVFRGQAGTPHRREDFQ
jgi:hypothetical protein